jgi:hypothetical protein
MLFWDLHKNFGDHIVSTNGTCGDHFFTTANRPKPEQDYFKRITC